MAEVMDSDHLWGLIERFAQRNMPVDKFELAFLASFGGNDKHLSEGEFEIFDWFFAKVDSYCGDPTLFDPDDDIDENQLRRFAHEALEKRVRIASSAV